MQKNKIYSADFYAYINSGSLASAKVVVPEVMKVFSPTSVLDVGCGVGAWCAVWQENGVENVVGTDGSYVDRESLLISGDRFFPNDLSAPVDLGHKFDLVTSLEVAEHVPEANADVFIDNIVRHGDMVLFSAAVPGQGGEFHVNEQPLEYWREKFLERGFVCFDPLRPLIAKNKAVEPWYRYNTLLYVHQRKISALSDGVSRLRVERGVPLMDFSPLSWKARNALIGILPASLSNILVSVKHAWVRRRYAT